MPNLKEGPPRRRATTRRFLYTLIEEGYALSDGTLFWLTPKTLELGFSYLSSLGLPAIAQPHLDALSGMLNESCSVSVLDGAPVVSVARAPANRIMSVNITIGTHFPAYATSMGRVLLAAFPADELTAYFVNTDLKPATPRTAGRHDRNRREPARGVLHLPRAAGQAGRRVAPPRRRRARMLVVAAHRVQRIGANRALVTMCIRGQGLAAVIENA